MDTVGNVEQSQDLERGTCGSEKPERISISEARWVRARVEVGDVLI